MWWTVAKEAATSWSSHKDARQGAALAYYSVFSLGPIIVIAIAIAGLFFGYDAVTSQVTSSLKDMLGDTGAKAIEAMLAGASRPAEGILATVLGVGALLFAAIGVVVQLKDALNVVWEVEESEESGIWHFARNYLLSFAAVLALGFLLLVSLLVTACLAAAGKFVAPYLPEGLLHVVSTLVSFAVVTIMFAMMFKWLPDVLVAWRDVWLGALLTALFFEVGKAAIGLYIGKQGLEFDLRRGCLDRRRADLGLLHLADHPDGRGDHPRLRQASGFVQATRAKQSHERATTLAAGASERRASTAFQERALSEGTTPGT
ncbi:YihY/virulence factor BrkB family protein [Bradyrhizobium sp. 13971]